jgi:hypothetical protein
MKIYKIRFNTDHTRDQSLPKWRVFLCNPEGEPFQTYETTLLVDEVCSEGHVRTFSSVDHMASGEVKYHMAYECSDMKLDESNNQVTAIFE